MGIKKDFTNAPLLGVGMLVPFAMVTTLFALWGFANDITNPLVKAFEEIFLISARESSLVQSAFYGGYATMAIPAAIFIRRFSYKSGIMVGLGLYATGAFMFIPASLCMQFWMFLLAFYVLTFGLAFLETTANPYILSMGDAATATRRLNLAQSFNPMGSLIGMAVSQFLILKHLNVSAFRDSQMAAHPEYANLASSAVSANIKSAMEQAAAADPATHALLQAQDLATIRLPYVAIGIVVLCFFCIFLFKKMPQTAADTHHDLHLFATFKRLVKNKAYVFGVFAQTLYVGAQIMCWTYIIHYGMDALKMSASEAQGYNIAAMLIFCSSRFVCTYLLKFVNSGALLLILSSAAMSLLFGVIYIEGMLGMYALVGVSACMSLMFPTIYGIALDGLGEDAKLASAGLIFAIVGGALMPPLQGSIIDMPGFLGLTGLRASFYLPLACFAGIAVYGLYARAHIIKSKKKA